MKQGTANEEARVSLEKAVGQKMLAAFAGYELPTEFNDLLRHRHIGGVTLFRSLNVQDPAQVSNLTASIQQAAAASDQPPLLIGADQEAGHPLALGVAAPF